MIEDGDYVAHYMKRIKKLEKELEGVKKDRDFWKREHGALKKLYQEELERTPYPRKFV